MFFHNKKYNILVWGDDFVADALYRWLKKSLKVKSIYNSKDVYSIIPFSNEFYTKRKISEDDILKLIDFAKEKKINLFVCDWSDNTQGIIEKFEAEGIHALGINKKFVKIETRKDIGKKFMKVNNIQTADFIVAQTKEEIFKGLEKFGYPLVVKANGPAKGLGVFICNSEEDIEHAYQKLTDGDLFPSQEKFIVEKYLTGDEFDIISLWDGKHLMPLPPLKDYKLRDDGNKGYNTGSMGQYFPYNLSEETQKMIKTYLDKLERGLRRIKANYRGAIYSALMVNEKGLWCLEYNMRIGLTEGPLFTLHLENEPDEIIDALIKQKLNKLKLKWKQGQAACINIVNKQYPMVLREEISADISAVKALEESGITVFRNAGLKEENGKYVFGGTLFFCLAKSSEDPIKEIYGKLEEINFSQTFGNCDYRKDIGQ